MRVMYLKSERITPSLKMKRRRIFSCKFAANDGLKYGIFEVLILKVCYSLGNGRCSVRVGDKKPEERFKCVRKDASEPSEGCQNSHRTQFNTHHQIRTKKRCRL